MNGKDLHDAVAFVGQDLIDMAEKETFSRSPWRNILSIAACLALILGFSAAGLRYLHTTAPAEMVPPVLARPEEVPSEADPTPIEIPLEAVDKTAENAFYETFHQLDKASLEQYLKENPEALDKGWGKLSINEAGPDEDGTSITTVQGDQVLAVDAANGILLIRVSGEGYQGVLAIAKDPTHLSHQAAAQLPVTGQEAGVIAEAHNGILAMSGASFLDPDGGGNGGVLLGYAMCDGTVYNEDAHLGWGNRRLEIGADGMFRLADVTDPVGEDTQNAVEFQPILIKNGEIRVDETCGWTGIQPRACIGQTASGEVLMLVIEGRMEGRSLGTDVIECAEILHRYGGYQALNLDGGSSAILWYDGEYVTLCSNTDLEAGRPLPSAFVYQRNS